MSNLTADGRSCLERETQTQSVKITKDFMTYFEIIQTCNWISENKFSKVSLQFPDEFLNICHKIYEEVTARTEADVYILGDTSYSNCCVDSVAAKHVQSDAMVHYGHSCLTSSDIPVYTVLPKSDVNLDITLKIIKDYFHLVVDTNLCLFYDTEFQHCEDEIAKRWFDQFPHAYVAWVERKQHRYAFLSRLVKNKDGQEFSMEKLKDCNCIYLGAKSQISFNFSISVPALDWYIMNPDSKSLHRLDETAWFKRRRHLVEKCKDANVIGILVCKLNGAETKDIISRLKQLCRINGKKSYILSVGKPNVAKLANFPEIDIYVMISCPENNLYDNRDFYKPIVYPYELEVALNSNRNSCLTTHVTDYNELLPGRRYFCDIEPIKQESDVSLVTGKIRTMNSQVSQTMSMELANKEKWEVESIGSYIQTRTWAGLEQKLGETEVKKTEEGRSGIPIHYTDESNK